MQTTLDHTGRRIPAPPARRFAPTEAGPDRRPEPSPLFTWKGDTRHTQGNITARTNRRPLTTADYRRLMHAPAGR